MKTAASYCYERRPILLPNIGFMEYLVKLDQKLQSSVYYTARYITVGEPSQHNALHIAILVVVATVY